MKQAYVYIMTNRENSVFYIGVTTDIKRRVYQHKNNLIPGFTSRYNLKKLVYVEYTSRVSDAIAREKQLKRWHRSWKINLIKSVNPDFNDLYN